MKIELQPWMTPNFVTAVTSPRPGLEGMQEAKWHISDIDSETLAKQCDLFRACIFAKAGKVDPANNLAQKKH